MILKRKIEDIQVSKFNHYSIVETLGIERGIFFRNPIKEVACDSWNYPYEELDPEYYYELCRKNLFRRLIEYIKGNYEIINTIIPNTLKENDMDWGVMVNTFISPIYFVREFKALQCKTQDVNLEVQSIKSKGYNDTDERVGGYCRYEKTIVATKLHGKIKTKRYKEYHFTYKHIVEEFLKNP